MATANTPNLECRMYESKYPEVDMAVMIQVKNIADMGAYVSLLEYNNIEGMILLSELSRRRIRSVSSLIKVGRQEPVMVLRVDKEKGYIDLSKRRVSEEDIQACEERYNKSKLVHSITRHVAETMNLDLEELYVNVGWPLYRKYGHAFEAFKVIVTDPDSVLDGLTKEVKEVVDGKEMVKMVPVLTPEVKEELVKNIRRRMTLQPLKIRADVEMKCFQFDGVLHIKEEMRRAEAAGNEECPVKIKVVAPPPCVLTTQTLDKVMAPVLHSATVGAGGSALPSGESSQQTGAPLLTGANVVPQQQGQIGMLEILRELIRNQQLQTEILQQYAVHQVTAPPAPQPELAFWNFREMQPEKFKGTEGGLQAEEWLTTIAILLRNAGVAPEAQVEAVKIQLSDIAKTWWQVEEFGLEKPVPWEIFEARFLNRFFPRSEWLELEQQFIMLKQWDSTVEKYTADFIRLSRFSPDLVRDPESKTRRYEQGLNVDIQVHLSMMEFTNFEAVYRAALHYEKKRDKLKKEQLFSNKRSSVAISGAKPSKFSKPSSSKEATFSVGSSCPPLSCTFCSRSGHVEKNCWRRLGLCIICGSFEHQRLNCPRFRGNPPAPASEGVFTITTAEVEASNQVITGTILVASFLVFVLFDSGASNSYISSRFVAAHAIPVSSLATE